MQGWPAFHRLLISLFKFLAPFIRTADLQNASRVLFRGAQRLLLVLLHDFPEFLSEYYFTICDAIPPRCTQLRNVVLSAYPPHMVLPDPHVVDVQSSDLDMGPSPTILSDFTTSLNDHGLRLSLDQYLSGSGKPGFVESLCESLLHPATIPPMSSERYNLSRINAVVLYIGASTVAAAKDDARPAVFEPSDLGVELLVAVASELDMEGQYLWPLSRHRTETILLNRTAPFDECCYTALALPQRTYPMV